MKANHVDGEYSRMRSSVSAVQLVVGLATGCTKHV